MNRPAVPSHPLLQFVHDVDPATEYGVAEGHTAQVEDPEVGLMVPAGHARHAAADEAPTVGEYVPTGQSVQLVDPRESENWPAGHCVHEPPGVNMVHPAKQRTHALRFGTMAQLV